MDEFMRWVTANWGVLPASALVSLITAVLFRWLDTVRPHLVAEKTQQEPKIDGYRTGTVRVTNAGDGTAYDIRLYGHLCAVWHQPSPDEPGATTLGHATRSTLIPTIHPGEAVQISVVSDPKTCDRVRLVLSYRPGVGRARLRWVLDVMVSKLPDELVMPAVVGEYVKQPRWWRTRWRLKEPRLERALHRP